MESGSSGNIPGRSSQTMGRLKERKPKQVFRHLHSPMLQKIPR